MIVTVYTIEETSFKHDSENSKQLLRFRDKSIRDKYLKNVTLRRYTAMLESGIAKPETFNPSKKSRTKLYFGFEHIDGEQYFRVKVGTEDIEIIETLTADDRQMKLEL